MLEDFEKKYRKEKYRKGHRALAVLYIVGSLVLLYKILCSILFKILAMTLADIVNLVPKEEPKKRDLYKRERLGNQPFYFSVNKLLYE